jgi:hypothetical protein
VAGWTSTTWPAFLADRVHDASWFLWSVPPESGVAAVNPDFRPAEVRWRAAADAPM